jgi:hypothetical protein
MGEDIGAQSLLVIVEASGSREALYIAGVDAVMCYQEFKWVTACAFSGDRWRGTGAETSSLMVRRVDHRC